jgi:hypothetical protein
MTRDRNGEKMKQALRTQAGQAFQILCLIPAVFKMSCSSFEDFFKNSQMYTSQKSLMQ